MEKLDVLWKLVNAASMVRDLALESKQYHFKVQPPITFYLHADYADVLVSRHNQAEVIVSAQLQAGFGWRVKTDQDEAGVYVVAVPRADIGSVIRAKFEVTVPHDTHLILKLKQGQFSLNDVEGTLEVSSDAGEQRIKPGSS